MHTSRDRVALSRFTFEMGDPGHLEHVIKAVRKIDGVFDVYRITGGKGPSKTSKTTMSDETSSETGSD